MLKDDLALLDGYNGMTCGIWERRRTSTQTSGKQTEVAEAV